ncbi:MAG: HAMP domain-containing histidine kinase [Deltaproteobacteria bacterium]|nr:HAMP domain-containing histidine kinase [Deltaproteobacteria bacterium]
MLELKRFPFSPLYLAFPAIMAAAVFLAYSGFRFSAMLARQAEDNAKRTTRELVIEKVERIEQRILDSDKTLFYLVDLDNLKDFRKEWRKIVSLSPAIDWAAVLDDQENVVQLAAKDPHAEPEAKRILVTQLLPAMLGEGLKSLPPNAHKHLHKEFKEGGYYLVSYIKKEHGGRYFTLALKVRMQDYVISELFPDLFNDVDDPYRYSVVDHHDRIVFGQPLLDPSRFVYESRFPTTLYMWRLQAAPRGILSLRKQVRERRYAEVALIGITLAVVLGGLLIMLAAVRKERRLNELKSDFISNVSHELKTPLSLIRMFGELIAMGKLKNPETSREYADIITRESERLARLIDNVLDFARMERGKVAYDFKPDADLAEVVERALEVYRYRLDREGFKLTVEIEPDLPLVSLDENAMTLVVLNRVDNAMKYGKEGKEGGEVTVRVRREGACLALSVQDNGPGIRPEEQRKVFERFYRAKQARGRPIRGSGIGLSLVRHIAEAHGGKVTLLSEDNRGCTFTVIVPVKAPPEAAAPEAA